MITLFLAINFLSWMSNGVPILATHSPLMRTTIVKSSTLSIGAEALQELTVLCSIGAWIIAGFTLHSALSVEFGESLAIKEPLPLLLSLSGHPPHGGI